MFANARQMLAAHQAALQDGMLDTIVADYDYPFALQVEEDLTVFATKAEFAAALAAYRGQLATSGVTEVIARMTAVELPRDGRFRIWADWDYVQQGVLHRAARRSIYYCHTLPHWARLDPTDSRIEMMQCTAFSGALSDPKPRRHLSA